MLSDHEIVEMPNNSNHCGGVVENDLAVLVGQSGKTAGERKWKMWREKHAVLNRPELCSTGSVRVEAELSGHFLQGAKAAASLSRAESLPSRYKV